MKSLLRPLNWEPSEEYRIPSGINVSFVSDLFDSMEDKYCTRILGLSARECEEIPKGIFNAFIMDRGVMIFLNLLTKYSRNSI